MNSRIFNQLLSSLKQNYSQEAYFIFVLMQKFGWSLTIYQVKEILGIDASETPEYLDNIDDFNWLMILEKLC